MVNFASVRFLPILFLLTIFSVAAMAQDEDYYAPQKSREEITHELKQLHRWGPKLGIEANASVGYSHFYTPSTITEGFSKTNGGLGYDLGIGLRVRLFHKLAIATGFNFSGRGYNMGFLGVAEVDTGSGGNIGVAQLEIDLSEKARMTFVGLYVKPIIEISRKFHLALLFHQSWRISYKGTSTQTVISGPPSYIGAVAHLVDESSVEILTKQFEIGIELAYKYTISPELILKPHIGINISTTAIFHTGIELPTPFGPWEQNPSFMTLRLGVIFETRLWLDKLKN